MTAPVDVDIPHQLGQAEARRRVENGFGQLAGWIPGGAVGAHRWEGDSLHFQVGAMGMTVTARLDVADTHIHAHLELPAFLAGFAHQIADKLSRKGPELLK